MNTQLLPATKAEVTEIKTAPLAVLPPPAAQPPSAVNQASAGLLARASRPHARNGKIARLPKLERDFVNRMLRNNIPYAKIVAALEDIDVHVTARNISNWKTRGGYAEWCADQERALQLSMLQDNVTDYLRKGDATTITEVGLQVAGTQLAVLLLQPQSTAELAAHPEKYAKIIETLCRVDNQLHFAQKQRDECINSPSKMEAIKEKLKDEEDLEEVRRIYSAKDGGKKPGDPVIPHRNYLPKPPSPLECLAPALHKAEQAERDREERALRNVELMRAFPALKPKPTVQ
jgi:hypothetical protein